MNKLIKVLILAALSAVTLLGVAEIDPIIDLGYEVIPDTSGNPGAGVKLAWTSDSRIFLAEGGCYGDYISDGQVLFVISGDGEVLDTVPVESYNLDKEITCSIYVPCAKIVIDAYKSGGEFLDKEEIVLGAVESELEVYTQESVSHPSGFGFDSKGKASAYSVTTHPGSVDFYLALDQDTQEPVLKSGECYSGKARGVRLDPSGYESIKIAPLPVQGAYVDSVILVSDASYVLYLDDEDSDSLVGDHFAKALVTGISGDRVALKLAYQTVPGLRWVEAK
ncbi:hypothetical protein JXM67_10020 [candidate division WOR-3 bacterium]|nr:hypothetical protein [candidate division WOR-3 bacterium]